jgi:hypothetical protein
MKISAAFLLLSTLLPASAFAKTNYMSYSCVARARDHRWDVFQRGIYLYPLSPAHPGAIIQTVGNGWSDLAVCSSIVIRPRSVSSQIAIYEGPHDSLAEACDTFPLRVVARAVPAIPAFYVLNQAQFPKRLYVEGLVPWRPELNESARMEYANQLCLRHAATIKVPEGPGLEEDHVETVPEQTYGRPGLMMFNN